VKTFTKQLRPGDPYVLGTSYYQKNGFIAVAEDNPDDNRQLDTMKEERRNQKIGSKFYVKSL